MANGEASPAYEVSIPVERKFDKIAEALAKAQGKITPPKKNIHVDFVAKTGNRVKYSYADLADVIEAIRLPLSENGISVSHSLTYIDDMFGMETSLLHTSGQTLESFYPLPHPKDVKPQEFGSELTYARRYSLSLLVGVASEEDDDGKIANDAAEEDKGKVEEPPKEENPYVRKIPLMEQLKAMVKKKGLTDEQAKDAIKKATGKDSSKELNDKEIESVIKFLGMKK